MSSFTYPAFGAPHQFARTSDRALLLVTFGSTYPGPHKTFAHIYDYFRSEFPDRDIFMAFTSGVCIRGWYKKTNEEYFSPQQWLSAIGAAGYAQVSVQSLHVIPGMEYSLVTDRCLPLFREQYPAVLLSCGKPLLWSNVDIEVVGNAIYNRFSEQLSRGEALVLMGHGNGTKINVDANLKYEALCSYLQSLDRKIVIGTVDYVPMTYDSVLAYLRSVCPPPSIVNFLPLMSVAGDHALNDMVGEWEEGEPLEEQSWRERLLHEGFVCDRAQHCHLYGLGEIDEVCELWHNHLLEAEQAL